MNLADFQEQFSRAILNPNMKAADIKKIPYLDSRASGGTLLDIQRTQVMQQLCTMLCDLYPTVHRVLADDVTAVAEAYFYACPPTSSQPSEALETFPYFLETAAATETTPFLPDLATLDLGYKKSFESATVDTIHSSIFTELAPEQLAAKRIQLHPACFWLSSDYAIYDIWHKASAPKAASKNPQNVIVIRPNIDVDVHAIDAGLAEALDNLDSGATLDRAFSQASIKDNNFRPVSALEFLIQNNLIMTLY